jgi:hypothetical protein
MFVFLFSDVCYQQQRYFHLIWGWTNGKCGFSSPYRVRRNLYSAAGSSEDDWSTSYGFTFDHLAADHHPTLERRWVLLPLRLRENRTGHLGAVCWLLRDQQATRNATHRHRYGLPVFSKDKGSRTWRLWYPQYWSYSLWREWEHSETQRQSWQYCGSSGERWAYPTTPFQPSGSSRTSSSWSGT